MAFERWKTEPGKAGPMATTVHRAADAHAMANPDIRNYTPATELELSQLMADMVGEYADIYTDIIRNRLRVGFTAADLQALRNELNALRADFLDAMEPNNVDMVKNGYGLGKASMQLQLEDAGVVVPGLEGSIGDNDFMVSFNRPDRFAIAAIANDNFSDLAGQTEQMSRAAVDVLRTRAGRVFADGVLRGLRPSVVAKRLEKELARRSVSETAALRELDKARARHWATGREQKPLETIARAQAWFRETNNGFRFIDRGGKKWNLEAYAKMAARTKLSIAKNEAAASAMKNAEVGHYQVSDHGTESEICEQFEGEVFWIGEGPSQGYPEASTLPPYHPNCQHFIFPRADITEPKALAEAQKIAIEI